MADKDSSRSDQINLIGPIEPLSEPDLANSNSLDHYTIPVTDPFFAKD